MIEQRIRIRAHYRGMREGIRLYAWWRDGTQYVGTTGRTLVEALAEVDSREKEAMQALYSPLIDDGDEGEDLKIVRTS